MLSDKIRKEKMFDFILSEDEYDLDVINIKEPMSYISRTRKDTPLTDGKSKHTDIIQIPSDIGIHDGDSDSYQPTAYLVGMQAEPITDRAKMLKTFIYNKVPNNEYLHVNKALANCFLENKKMDGFQCPENVSRKTYSSRLEEYNKWKKDPSVTDSSGKKPSLTKVAIPLYRVACEFYPKVKYQQKYKKKPLLTSDYQEMDNDIKQLCKRAHENLLSTSEKATEEIAKEIVSRVKKEIPIKTNDLKVLNKVVNDATHPKQNTLEKQWNSIRKKCYDTENITIDFAKKNNLPVIGIYGSLARGICTPDASSIDSNILLYGQLTKTLYKSDRGDTLVTLSVDENTSPWSEYPKPEGSVEFTMGQIIAHHSRYNTDKGKKIFETILSQLNAEDRKNMGMAMIGKAKDFFDSAQKSNKAKDLTRGACDFLPYGILWTKYPEIDPSLTINDMETIIKYTLPKEIANLCRKGLVTKAKLHEYPIKDLAKIGSQYISKNFGNLEIEKSKEYVRSKLIKFTKEFAPQQKLA